ncbi:MAG: hypothetical protein WCB85_13655 [Candidatus Dormiibacterota bacterium]
MTTTPDQPTELELLHRLMTSSPPFAPLERAVEQVVGGLPPALVDEVPLPAGGRLVGSQLTSHLGRLSELKVVLDVGGSPADIAMWRVTAAMFNRERLVTGSPASRSEGVGAAPLGEVRRIRT